MEKRSFRSVPARLALLALAMLGAALLSLCLGAAAVGYRTESMHGAGSPQAQRIMIARQGNLQAKKQMAKEIAGIQN